MAVGPDGGPRGCLHQIIQGLVAIIIGSIHMRLNGPWNHGFAEENHVEKLRHLMNLATFLGTEKVFGPGSTMNLVAGVVIPWGNVNPIDTPKCEQTGVPFLDVHKAITT